MASSAYSSEQLEQYFDTVQLPDRTRSLPRDFELLRILHAYQISTFPYENLLLHYDSKREVNIEPQALWRKIMAGRGRGGYCFELCIFFNHVLRACGFDAYLSGVRIRLREEGVPVGNYGGWRHIVSIVQLQDQKYMVDVSFGGDGATQPLPLLSGHAINNLGTQEIRLVEDRLPEQISPGPSWVYQYRNAKDKPWNSYYSFHSNEWVETDFEGPNFYVNHHPESFQRHLPLIVKFLRDGDRISGKRMLVGAVVKENRGGKTEVIRVCTTESERVESLRELFGIGLTTEEVQSIRGYETEIGTNIAL